jgi:hypothetical protein
MVSRCLTCRHHSAEQYSVSAWVSRSHRLFIDGTSEPDHKDMNPKDFIAPFDAYELANFVKTNNADTLIVP